MERLAKEQAMLAKTDTTSFFMFPPTPRNPLAGLCV
jgi:hypothetical protein